MAGAAATAAAVLLARIIPTAIAGAVMRLRTRWFDMVQSTLLVMIRPLAEHPPMDVRRGLEETLEARWAAGHRVRHPKLGTHTPHVGCVTSGYGKCTPGTPDTEVMGVRRSRRSGFVPAAVVDIGGPRVP